MERLIVELDSLLDGELAMTMLIACGQRAVSYIERFLLEGSPRTIAIPRCRAVHALGELGAYSVLISYFERYVPPRDAEVLFAEDAVRSAVARELLRWKSEEVFHVLLEAAREIPTGGLVLALGEFRRRESVPLLFEALEDDLCREEAKNALRKVSEDAYQYAFLSIRGLTNARLQGPSALRRRRAVLQLLGEFGVSPKQWPDVRVFLEDNDADVVIAAAGIGFSIGSDGDRSRIIRSLFRVSDRLNWVQEDQVEKFLDSHRELAREMARKWADTRKAHGEQPNWLSPSWRLLRHVLGRELEGVHHGAA
jgi:hypothetical protein